MNKDYIQRFISHLKGLNKIENQKDFALKIGYKSESSFSHAIKKDPIPEETLSKIKIAFPEVETWDKSVISSEDIQNFVFGRLPIEDRLKLIFEQNIKILKENSEIKDLLNQIIKESKDHKNIIVDYIDLALIPMKDYIEETKKEKENK